MKKKAVFWCLFFVLCFCGGMASGGAVRGAYLNFLENRFERWREEERLQKLSPYGDRVCLTHDLVMMGRLYVGYYTTQWYVEDGKSVRADDDCADDTLRLLKEKFSSYPFVIYEKSSRDLYKEMEERD